MNAKTLLLALLFSIATLPAMSADKSIEVNVSLSPAGSFLIKTEKVKGKITKSGPSYTSKKLYVKIKHLKSGISLRDGHMAKRLNPTKKSGSKITVTKLTAKNGKGVANIKINGISKPFKFTYKIDGKTFQAAFKLNIAKFNVKDISYAGVGAEEIVSISANIPIK